MSRRACVMAILVAVTTGCGPARTGPVDTGPGTLDAARRYLEGRWSLISYEVYPPGQPPIKLSGDSAGAASLVYDAFGNMTMEIRVADPKVAEELERAGIPLNQGMISTTGRTAIDMQARTITYFLQGEPPLLSSRPGGPLSFRRPRHWEVQGNMLTLTTKSDDGKPVSIGRWQKSP